jgi:hypothetical protein
MSSEVTKLIAALRAGTLSLEEVAQRFRERSWPDRMPPEAETNVEIAAATLEDPPPYVSGSFDDVAAALHRKDLTLREYEVLAQAAADAMSREDRRDGARADPD